MKVALYARVSTADKEQNPEVQLEALRKYCDSVGWEIYHEYIDHASAVDFARRLAWSEMMKHAQTRRFDLIFIWKLDRAFRDVLHGATTLTTLRAWSIGFRSLNDSYIDTTTPFGEAMYHITNAWSQLDRQLIRMRIKEGIAYAIEHGTKSGKPIGRKPKNVDFTIISKALQDASTPNRPVSYSEAARIIGKNTGISVSPALVLMRIRREADRLQISADNLLKQIVYKEDELCR